MFQQTDGAHGDGAVGDAHGDGEVVGDGGADDRGEWSCLMSPLSIRMMRDSVPIK